MNLAPIALFTYTRLTLLKKTLRRLKSCKYASNSKLYIFSDSNKNSLDYENVKLVRNYLKSINGFLEVLIIERRINTETKKRGVASVLFEILKFTKYTRMRHVDLHHGNIMITNTKAKRITYSLKNKADYKCKVLESRIDGMLLNIQNHEIWVKLIGEFNAYNLLAVYSTSI